MPRLSERRAVSSKINCLANRVFLQCRRGRWDGRRDRSSALDDGQDVLLADDEEFLAVDLELRPRVLGVEDLVARLDVHRLALAVVERLARPDRRACKMGVVSPEPLCGTGASPIDGPSTGCPGAAVHDVSLRCD